MGHEYILFPNGDGFKKIPSGLAYGPPKNAYFDLGKWLIEQPNWLEGLLKKNDIVQLMNPYSLILPRRIASSSYRQYIIWKLKSARKHYKVKLGLSVAGCSALTIKEMGNLKRSPCAGCMTDTQTTKCVLDVPMNYKYEKELYTLCDCVIPFGGCAYERSAIGLAALPMPVDHQSLPYNKNVVLEKIRILHGINHAGFKGSKFIINALNRLSERFENAEVIIVERLPFKEYLQLVSTCNVVVDQLFGDGLGMNALLSMALGRVVLTSHDPACIRKIYGESAPALDISSEESVYSVLSEMLTTWSAVDFLEVGERSRLFVEAYCDASSIAARVLDYYLERME
ncbi:MULTISPECIES: hypothetical protein [unclassified Thermosynechococcus]|uniref:hypothetical protein n=1 Tax=unclassified Thermosynechococcus TaxID=2622553 RepID=UPI00267319E0|nr:MULTISPECIES: hypothetical protein [unclassified Thermosynechococcus]WKT82992.1 hypothetical protein QYC28_09170 [Thermosynechococcus sp. HY596]WNC62120.1 hypothetical protein RHK13_09165 [Thermosynechococcus sp. HY591]WNC64673.1 hypothetical protein RHK28_09195 [Thermosynechococcus sp. HY593]